MAIILYRKKIYVDVLLRHDINGNKTPLSIIWKDGRVFDIDSLNDVRYTRSLHVGGNGVRYTIFIDGKCTYLFEEDNRWFVEAKV